MLPHAGRARRHIEILRGVLGEVQAARAQPEGEPQLLDKVCRRVQEIGEFPLVWVGYAEPRAPWRVTPVSVAGPASSYVDGVDIRWSDTPQGRGPTGAALREGRVVVARSLRSDETFGPWRARARAHGLESSAAVPMFAAGVPVGALNVYSHSVDAFDADEVALLDALGKLLGLALRDVRGPVRSSPPAAPPGLQEILDSAALEALPDMVFVHRSDGPVVAINNRVIKGYRCTREDVFFGDPAQFSGLPQATQRVLQAIREAAAGVPVDIPQWIARRKDGTTFPCEVRLRRMEFAEPSKASYVLALVRDTSSEEALRRHELQAYGADTATELASTLAHDFANLLMGVAGHLDTALESAGPTPRGAIEAALAATRRAEDLARQIQRLGRPRPLRPRACSLTEAIALPARFAAHGAKTTLHLSLDEALGPVLADLGAVERIVHNVVLNAAEAAGEDGHIWVESVPAPPSAPTSAGSAPQEGARPEKVTVHFDDDGPGIPPSDRARVFAPHFTTKPGGTGLGLVSSLRLAKRSGGDLRLSASPRGGARFTLTLPHADAPAPTVDSGAADHGEAPTPRADPSPAPQAGPVPPSVGADPSPRRALVVEDDEALRDALARLLQRDGFEIVGAPSGADALAQAREALGQGAPFDVAIVDLSLSDGGPQGAALLGELREIVPELGAVVCSAWHEAPEMLHPKEHGFDATLPKPFRRRELQEAAAAALFRGRSRSTQRGT